MKIVELFSIGYPIDEISTITGKSETEIKLILKEDVDGIWHEIEDGLAEIFEKPKGREWAIEVLKKYYGIKEEATGEQVPLFQKKPPKSRAQIQREHRERKKLREMNLLKTPPPGKGLNLGTIDEIILKIRGMKVEVETPDENQTISELIIKRRIKRHLPLFGHRFEGDGIQREVYQKKGQNMLVDLPVDSTEEELCSRLQSAPAQTEQEDFNREEEANEDVN